MGGVVCCGLDPRNVSARHAGLEALDPPPFTRLQGLLTLVALLTTTVVLIAQSRDAKLESHRAHLDLQVNLLTEQKVTKRIHLLEELRRDLPMVRDRHNPDAASLQRHTDTAGMLSAIRYGGVATGAGKSAAPPV